jgi:hypothetical protein
MPMAFGSAEETRSFLKMDTSDQKQKIAIPTQRVTDPNFKYVPQAKTDVQETWKRFGWVPPVHKDQK